MADALKAWLRARLGVIMDLTPETFGRHTRDGRLLAQILHSYDIISGSQLSTIPHTQDPALSRVNLRTLRIWLKLINVTLSDGCIEEISNSKGAAALQLFYKVYLSLEGKDRLHFIALQKEREKFTPISDRFDVSRVSEDPPPYEPAEHPLSKPLSEATDTVLWHRDKFWKIVEACRRERQRFEVAARYPVVEPVEHFVRQVPPEDGKREESERLDEFACGHPARRTRDRYGVVECCPSKRLRDVSYVGNRAAAAEYVDSRRKRRRRAIEPGELKLRAQTAMMRDVWEKLLAKQERRFDERLGERVLDQSRYERRMTSRLCEVRDLRNRIVENRGIVDTMLSRARENELRLRQDRCRESTAREIENVETERRRMLELRRKIREERARGRRERYRELCAAIARDLADVAVKAADCRRANDNRIPRAVWNEWRTLFLKSQPIFEIANRFDEIEAENEEEIESRDKAEDEVHGRSGIRTKNGNEEEPKTEEDARDQGEVKSEEERKRLIRLELERRAALADADFEKYRDSASPWDEFVSRRGEEEDNDTSRLGRVVLGHVVHRLLEILYPRAAKVAACPLPRVKSATIVLGVTNPALHEQLRVELLKRSGGMHLLRMEDAINHCLERYKREMADVEYIDLNIISATARDIKRSEAKSKMDNSVDRRSKKPERTKMTAARSTAGEKQTQTPRRIPYDDMHPILSDAAYIGKWTYEFLMLGEPISNELNTKIIIEHLKDIGDVEGWVLINYPNTYEQMAMLEKALTGHEMSSSDRKIIDFADVNAKDVDPPSPRIVFESDEIDTFAICRQSRLLPNPMSRANHRHDFSTTFMTMYIKAMPKSKSLDNQDPACMPLPDDATSMDEYYADQNIAYGFYYNVLDTPTMKQLATFITGDQMLVERLSSDLVESIPQTQHVKQVSPADSKTAIIKRWIPKSKWENLLHAEKTNFYGTESHDLQAKTKVQSASSPVRPGEDGWQWIDLSQPPILLEFLATLWENMEEAYVENLKDILSLKRMHTTSIVPYKDLVWQNLTKFVDRPDKRQDLLNDFHCAFNEIDEDLRRDSDMKCELHCRVADLRAELWELCDARRHEAEVERIRAVRNQWVLMEAVALVNMYIGILQTEIDRFVDTVQILQDYYVSMAQKPLQESRFSKTLLDHVELENDLWEKSQAVRESSKGTAERTQTKTESIGASARIERFRTEIEDLLSDVSRSFDPNQSVVLDAIEESIRQVRSAVDSISSVIMETLKNEEKAAVSKTEVKSRESERITPDSTLAELARRSRDIVEEWRYAVLFEIGRILQIWNVLKAAARSDVTFLLDTTRQTFHRIHHYIVDRYKREIESVNVMTNVFYFAIEEAKPIQQQLLLDGDQFVVRSNVLMFPDDPRRFPLREALSPLRFRMIQLGRLSEIFRRVAPRGVMSERALVYILQDLVSCGEEDCHPFSVVPCAWRRLRPPDIESLIERLFGTSSEYIEWREFVVYAMDLPVPSHRNILEMRAAFKAHDPESRETIARDHYRSTPLWFLEHVETPSDVTKRDEVRLDEENERDDDEEITEAMLAKVARIGQDAVVASSLKDGLIETSEDNIGAVLRLILAKELLWHMYLINQRMVNYTVLLLAFCKDEDPREGLGKAFTLAMGIKVCTDAVEGERYVERLVEEKRRAKKTELSRDHLRAEANEIAREITSYVMDSVAKRVVALDGRRSRDRVSASRGQIVIQKLNELGEIDPADLLSPEAIAEHLITEDPPFVDDDEYERLLESAASIASENRKVQRSEKVVFWLPREVCLTVLSTCLPWHATQPDLFQTSLSLREGIARAYDELKDSELNGEQDAVLAHRLVNHSFIRELLSASNKFVTKDMAAILHDILKNRDDEI